MYITCVEHVCYTCIYYTIPIDFAMYFRFNWLVMQYISYSINIDSMLTITQLSLELSIVQF